MIKTLFLIVMISIIAVSPMVLLAEEIYSLSENSYETGDTTIFLTPDQIFETSEFIFKSSLSLRGRMEISSGAGDDIEITYRKVLFAESREQADSFANLISLDWTVDGNSFIWSGTAPLNAPWSRTANLSGQIECEIFLPERYSINIDVEGYYINIKGPFPEAEIKANYCDEIRVSKIDLGLEIDARNSPINIRDINGPAKIVCEGANITARNIKSGIGIATFENKRGTIKVIGFEGDELSCIAEDGKIDLEDLSLVEGARAYLSNSGINSDIDVDVEDIINSTIEIINHAADVDILLPKDIAAEFEISTDPDDGEIDIKGVPLVTRSVDWGRLNAQTLRHNSRVLVDTRGTGKVTIRRKDY